MNKNYTCCVTGHRNIPINDISYVQNYLYWGIMQAIQSGYTHFISGFAQGADMIFAKIISDLKDKYPITLEAAIPYQGRMNTPDKLFHQLIEKCDIVTCIAPIYSKSCYMERNRYMIDCSTLVIAVYDGRKIGGTAATIKYAYKNNCTVRVINL